MPDPLQALLGAGAVPTTAFPPTSRYHAIPVIAHDPRDGGPAVPYLGRRLCPSPERFSRLYEVRIAEGDRRDTVAARHSGDPALWWQLADANGAIDPRDLTARPGSTIDVTLPADVPGAPDA
jgi:hypothetical protein